MKTQPSKLLASAAQQFLAEQTEEHERLILRELNTQLMAEGMDPLPDGFVEWGCVEHGVIHICAFEGQQWIQIDPETGVAETA
jgi:hypothetical protein